MTIAALECKGLTLDYGNGTVIGPLDLRVEPGTCLALVGSNGAGKTSLLHMALGLRRPTQGTVSLFGAPSAMPDARKGIGYLQEAVEFHERARALSLLKIHCKLTGDGRLFGRFRAGVDPQATTHLQQGHEAKVGLGHRHAGLSEDAVSG
jgi:ABC-type multidrug transport system ATPase subunit